MTWQYFLQWIQWKHNDTEFSRAIYIFQMCYEFSYLVITDTDSNSKRWFSRSVELIKIKHHVYDKGNHNKITVESSKFSLNSSVMVFNNERKSNGFFLEGEIIIVWAWNSTSVAGTDIRRLLLVFGKEFHLPIDFISRDHIAFSNSPSDINYYAFNLVEQL